MATLTLQPDATAGQDVYIRNGVYAGRNFGVADLIVGETNVDTTTARTLIKFDLSSLPSTTVISSVVLSLYVTNDLSSNARTFRVFRSKRAWVEGTQNNVANTTGASWNDYAVGSAWQTAGGFGANDCEQTDIGSRSFTATETVNTFKDFTLTNAQVQEWVSGAFANNGILIKADTETDDAYSFASSDNATAANRPKLVVVYKVPSLIAGISSGSGSVSGALKGKTSLEGVDAGTVSATGTLRGKINLASTATGTSTETALLTAVGTLTASVNGSSAVTGIVSATGYLQGSSGGTTTAIARPSSDASLSGESAGQATVSGDLSASGNIQGQTNGIAFISVSASAIGYLSGNIGGTATIISVIMAVARIQGSAAGSSTSSLDVVTASGFTAETFRGMFRGAFKSMR